MQALSPRASVRAHDSDATLLLIGCSSLLLTWRLCPNLASCTKGRLLRQVYDAGRMSRHMDGLALGDQLWFKGPRGRFSYTPNMKQHIGTSMSALTCPGRRLFALQDGILRAQHAHPHNSAGSLENAGPCAQSSGTPPRTCPGDAGWERGVKLAHPPHALSSLHVAYVAHLGARSYTGRRYSMWAAQQRKFLMRNSKPPRRPRLAHAMAPACAQAAPRRLRTPPSRLRHAAGMIAGGTGITPMYQVAAAILKDPSDRTEVPPPLPAAPPAASGTRGENV